MCGKYNNYLWKLNSFPHRHFLVGMFGWNRIRKLVYHNSNIIDRRLNVEYILVDGGQEQNYYLLLTQTRNELS